jgi:PTH1 family peptidyl-tRNA hydrolase
MKLLVGLGNPGKQYFNSRHNLGFMVTEMLLQKYNETWKNQEKFHALVQEVLIGNHTLSLMQPHTFMNNSGKSVQSFANYFKIEPKDICVVYDDIALPIGRIRVRTDGGAGGHNGVQSIIDELGSDSFIRIRLGIGAENTELPLHDFVLAPFTENEAKTVREMVEKATQTVELLVTHGTDHYLSKYHDK